MTNPAIATFIAEASDLLEEMEEQLLSLETDPDKAMVDAVFRALHTVKGSGAMFGFTILANFTHHFENAFDQVREGRLEISRALIDLSLRARDYMVTLLDAGGDTKEAKDLEASATSQEIIDELQSLVSDTSGAPQQASGTVSDSDSAQNGVETFTITFKPAPSDMHNGMRPDLLIEELGDLGDLSVVKDFAEVPDLSDLDPTECHITWRMRLTTSQGRAAIDDVFIFADDAELNVALEQEKPVAGAQKPSDPETEAEPAATDRRPANIRVSSGRLDDMMDRLGELVIAQARLDQIASQFNDPGLESVVEEVERLVTGLRDTTLSIRMLPIEGVFGKFRRVVRDLSQELGKTVELVTRGGETELDKNVLDRLSEPLVHMIRNSMDHGIEDAETRRAAGKPEMGRVTLSAQQESGEILITLRDDGAGLDTEAIRARAIDRGLVQEGVEISDADLRQLIFAPGFSTARKLTSVSGRGVGMDAVKTTVDELKGTLDVASTPGKGTCVSLRLPVSLAIIDGLLIRLGGARYVIPLSSVEECVELNVAERERESGRTMLRIREMLVPFLDLSDIFCCSDIKDEHRRVVIVRADGARLGLVVDDILGQTQTVVKSLSVFHRNVEGFAGATILGDGTTALIIDVAVLVRSAHERSRETGHDPRERLSA